MKRLKRYIDMLVAVVLMAVASACSDESEEVVATSPDEVALTVSVVIPDADDGPSTRTFGETTAFDAENASIKVLAFDENHLLTNIYTGSYTGRKSGTDDTFCYSLTVKTTDRKRVFHLLVNFNDLDVDDIPYGTEGDIFSSKIMTVGEGTDVYWQRVELDSVGDKILKERLTGVKLVRNFSKLSLSITTDVLEDIEWGVMCVPTRGSVAPYIGSQKFAQYLTDDGVATYSNLTEQGYVGNVPHGSDATIYRDATADYCDKIEWQSLDNPIYMFENEGSSKSSDWYQTAIFFRGHYVDNGTKEGVYTYYRLSLVDPDNDYLPLNILRNICYTISVNNLSSRGYDTASEAFSKSANNDISSSTKTSSFNSIMSNNAALHVEYVRKYILYPGNFTLNYRYVPNLTGYDSSTNKYTVSNGDVTLKRVGDNKVELLTSPITDANFAINAYSVASTDNTNGYRTITFTPNNPPKSGQSIVSTIRLAVTDADHSNLYRNIVLVLRERYMMKNVRIENDTDGGTNCFVLTVDVPSSIPEEIFPLEFTLEASPACIYPTVGRSVMEVRGQQKSILGSATKTFNYRKSLSYSVFNNVVSVNSPDGVVESDGYRRVSFFFKVNALAVTSGDDVTFGIYCNALSNTPDADLSLTTASTLTKKFRFLNSDGTYSFNDLSSD